MLTGILPQGMRKSKGQLAALRPLGACPEVVIVSRKRKEMLPRAAEKWYGSLYGAVLASTSWAPGGEERELRCKTHQWARARTLVEGQ